MKTKKPGKEDSKTVNAVIMYLLLLSCIIVNVASCTNPAVNVIPETVPEIVEEILIDDEAEIIEEPEILIFPEIIVPDEPEIIEPEQIQEEEIIEVMEIEFKPIEEFGAYVVDNTGRIWGLEGALKTPIVFSDTENRVYPIEDFFTKNGKVFFSTEWKESGEAIPDTDPVEYEAVTVTHYFVQTGSDLSEIEEGLYPLIPESKRVEMGIAPWSIETTTIGEITISALTDHNPDDYPAPSNHIIIDGYFLDGDHMWFSAVPHDNDNAPGLYYSLQGSRQFRKIMDYGRVFKL